jgi:hypothetical protein
MNKKSIIIISVSLLSVAALTYLVVANNKRKKENEQLKKSVEDLTKKYKPFN